MKQNVELLNQSIFFKDLFYKSFAFQRDEAGNEANSGKMRVFATPQLQRKSDTKFQLNTIVDVSSAHKDFILTASIWVKFEFNFVNEGKVNGAEETVASELLGSLVKEFIQDFMDKTPYHLSPNNEESK